MLASVLCFVGGLILLGIVIAIRRSLVSRREFARLQADVRQLSEDVKGLLTAEQRRFIKELNAAKKEDGGASMAA